MHRSQAGGVPLEVRGAGGVTLAGEAFGAPGRPPVILLHGGGQTRWAWGATARALGQAGMYAVAMDLRGHGESQWAPTGDYALRTMAADLAAVCAAVEGTPAIVGASLGGLTTMVAVAGGLRCRAVVLVDVTPRLEPDGVRRILTFMKAHPQGFGSLEEAAEAIGRYLPHRRPPKDLSGLQKNLRQGEDGRFRWHWDPALLQNPELDMADGTQAEEATRRLTQAARTITVPTLLVRGARSDLVSEENAQQFRAAVPHAQVVDLAAAGHMVAGDRNDAFTQAVVSFLVEHLHA